MSLKYTHTHISECLHSFQWISCSSSKEVMLCMNYCSNKALKIIQYQFRLIFMFTLLAAVDIYRGKERAQLALLIPLNRASSHLLSFPSTGITVTFPLQACQWELFLAAHSDSSDILTIGIQFLQSMQNSLLTSFDRRNFSFYYLLSGFFINFNYCKSLSPNNSFVGKFIMQNEIQMLTSFLHEIFTGCPYYTGLMFSLAYKVL